MGSHGEAQACAQKGGRNKEGAFKKCQFLLSKCCIGSSGLCPPKGYTHSLSMQQEGGWRHVEAPPLLGWQLHAGQPEGLMWDYAAAKGCQGGGLETTEHGQSEGK